uniref:Uncharacterized protein n=1 Tax=Trypanosoma vivax (strain Y486) TaxID=1055687 RepID=G0TUM4_TRYVY|nr:conserved hypothetical protein [Trypanosoma vivax Y486]
MLRRLGASVSNAGRPTSRQSVAVSVSRRHLEPMSTWYLASWAMVWYYAFFFWMPMVWTDIMVPSFVYNKLPVIHFIQEKRAEQKLRRVLDETYTEWTDELDQTHVTDAIARSHNI